MRAISIKNGRTYDTMQTIAYKTAKIMYKFSFVKSYGLLIKNILNAIIVSTESVILIT